MKCPTCQASVSKQAHALAAAVHREVMEPDSILLMDLEFALSLLDRALSEDWTYKLDADSAERWLNETRQKLEARKEVSQ